MQPPNDPIEDLIRSFLKKFSGGESTPASTYRIQFNHRYRFSDATQIIPYLRRLGITHLYASPYLQARRGSLHGYDISDHNTLNQEIGSESEHAAMIEALRKESLGHILDVVPNHMGITERSNYWWMDVLENGQNSPYAHHFDIDWHPIKKELRRKVLLPVLGDQYGKVLEKQELKLTFAEGGFWITYYDNRFPIAPQTYPKILRHRLEKVEETLEDDPDNLQEYLGITLALLHLPAEIEPDPKRLLEERRQREWIKKRLAKLYGSHEKVKKLVDENISIFNGQPGSARSFDLLDELLNNQFYRLAYWRVAADEINYRRFFDINDLAAISTEKEEVFEETHRLIFKFIQEGKLDGLRIDHPDGLYDPLGYFKRLQKRCFVLRGLREIAFEGPDEERKAIEKRLAEEAETALAKRSRPGTDLPLYVIVEKILNRGEQLPEKWPVHGTVGYEFANALNAVFIDSRNAEKFDEIYGRFIGSGARFSDIVYERKKLIMNTSMASEINVLAYQLNKLSEKDRLSRDFTLYSLRDAIREIIACFPIYRTYINQDEVVEEHDRKYIEMAVRKAKQRSPATDISILDYLKRILLLQYPEYFTEDDRKEQLTFVQKFQRCTGPIMAKGLEDTAFYVYNRLVSLNDVGGDPQTFGIPLSAFHQHNAERLKSWPYSMLSTSTHDTKRSEDVRARINVLSEIPEIWQASLQRWAALNRSKKTELEGERAPDANDEYLLYQTLLGVWPPGEPSAENLETFKNRIKDYMAKASKEAKINTSWISPNEEYDKALLAFVEAVLDTSKPNPFLDDFNLLQRKVAHYGAYNSLSQLLIKIASPGVPDIYQGNELFDFSLVDPDNRRPVDYSSRIEMLEAFKKERGPLKLSLLRDLLREKESGGIKLYTTWRGLSLRREHPDVFLKGAYLPHGEPEEGKEHIVAFSRKFGNDQIIAIAPRLLVSLTGGGEEPPVGKCWEGIDLDLGEESAGRYQNHLTGEIVEAAARGGRKTLSLSKVFANFPLALLKNI